MIGFWSDYGWGGTYDFESSDDSKVGAFSIKASYGGYGGINLKNSRGGVDASNLVSVRFWVKGDAAFNGPGNPILQLRVNAQEYDFEIINGVWSIFQFPLSNFGSPSTIEALVLQNRQASDLLVYVDQIELLAAVETEEPSSQPSSSPVTPSPLSRAPSDHPVTPDPSTNPTPSPSSGPSPGPSPEPSLTTEKPSLSPVKQSTPSPTDAPADCVLVCSTPPPTLPLETPNPTPAPVTTSSGTFTIYGETIASGWSDYSSSGTYDPSSTEEAHSGSKSFKADINGWGQLNLKAASPGVLLSDLGTDADATNVSLRFWVKGSGSNIVLRVRVNGKMHDTTVSPSGSWTQVSLPLTLFYSPDNVFQVEIQNRASSLLSLYFDEIELHKNLF